MDGKTYVLWNGSTGQETIAVAKNDWRAMEIAERHWPNASYVRVRLLRKGETLNDLCTL